VKNLTKVKKVPGQLEQLANFPSKATQVAAPSTVNAPGTRVFVLRALLTNAPNSYPQECVFSMFNATFGEDQKSSFGDYLELAMQSQMMMSFICSCRNKI
jgi:hypothetical protein